MLKPQIFPDHEAASRYAADWIARLIREHPSLLLCVAAGTTPMRTYALLAEQGATEPELFARVRLLKLDEWGGLAMNDLATCEQHLRKALIDPLGLQNRFTGFRSHSCDAEAECKRIATWLENNGPIDLCVLGLGVNGHLGFNEPAADLQPHAHVAELSHESLSHPMLAGTPKQPSHGLTLGMADILQSRRIVLLVTGRLKRVALERLLTGRITTAFPASLLHLHPEVKLVCDSATLPQAE